MAIMANRRRDLCCPVSHPRASDPTLGTTVHIRPLHSQIDHRRSRTKSIKEIIAPAHQASSKPRRPGLSRGRALRPSSSARGLWLITSSVLAANNAQTLSLTLASRPEAASSACTLTPKRTCSQDHHASGLDRAAAHHALGQS